MGKVMGLRIWGICRNTWQLRRNHGAGQELLKGLPVVICCGGAVRADIVATALSWGSPLMHSMAGFVQIKHLGLTLTMQKGFVRHCLCIERAQGLAML